LLILLAIAGASWGDVAQEPPVEPDKVDGLVAWYSISSLHQSLRDQEHMTAWKDWSEKGHDLTDQGLGLPSVFYTLQVNDKPTVVIGKASSFSVAEPFDLQDHTIFVVSRSGRPSRALFRSDKTLTVGVVLRVENERHLLQHGSAFEVTPYNQPLQMTAAYNISTLGRQDATLKCFIDGSDVSSNASYGDPIRVGKFFLIAHSRYSHSDARGLHVSEMIFYDRYLSHDERAGVTSYLSRKYAIDVLEEEEVIEAAPVEVVEEEPEVVEIALPSQAAARAWFGTTSAENVNETVYLVPWDVRQKLEPPFRQDSRYPESRIYIDGAGRVEITVRLTLTTRELDTDLRLLILKNSVDYLPGEVSTGPMGLATEMGRATLTLSNTVDLAGGDYFEVVISRAAAEGEVLIEPESATLALTLE